MVPIHDLVVKEPEGDLVIATHGRSFWILDDLGAVRATFDERAPVLVKPRPTIRYMVNGGFSGKPTRGKNYRMPGAVMVTFTQTDDPRTGDKVDEYLDAAKNPPNGAIIQYFLRAKPEGDISLTFLTADGAEIRKLSSHDPEAEAKTEEEKKAIRKHKEPRIPKEEGLNRFAWNLRYPDATKVEDDDVANELVEGAIAGPQVAPGAYRVRLQVGDQTYEQEFEVRKDPRVSATDADLQAQFALLKQVHDRFSETHRSINTIRTIRRRAQDWAARAKDKPELESVARAAEALIERLKPIEAELIQVNAKARGDQLNFPSRLNAKLAYVMGVIASSDAAPTASARSVFDDLSNRLQTQLDQLSEAMATELAFLNQSIQNANLPPVGA